VDLRRRDNECVVEPMALQATNGEARQRLASAGSNRGVDRVDAIGEAREDFVEPFALSIGALRLRPWQLVDAPGDLCQRFAEQIFVRGGNPLRDARRRLGNDGG
jgi:hypothetical protein